jgi:hypothetical protein
MAKRMVTTTEAQGILKGRGIDAPYQTLVRWVRKGLFPGAKSEATPRGPVWKIPADTLANFQPPKQGRPKTTKKGKR